METILSSFKTGLYSDYAYDMFRFWKYVLMYMKKGRQSTPYTHGKHFYSYSLSRDFDGNISLNTLEGESCIDTSFFKQYGSYDSLNDVYKRIGNAMKIPIPSGTDLCYNDIIKYEYSLNRFSSYNRFDILPFKQFWDYEAMCEDKELDDNDLLFGTNLTVDINFNNDDDFRFLSDYQRHNEKYISNFGYFKKLFDILECEKENDTYKVSILDAMFVTFFDNWFFSKNGSDIDLRTSNFETIPDLIEKEDFLNQTFQAVKFAKKLTFGEYCNFHKFLLNRKSLEKKNPEFVKKLIGTPRDPVSVEFAKNSIDETKNLMMEMYNKFEKTENDLSLKLKEFVGQIEKIISDYKTDYKDQKNKIKKFMSDMKEMNGYDIFMNTEYDSKMDLLDSDFTFKRMINLLKDYDVMQLGLYKKSMFKDSIV